MFVRFYHHQYAGSREDPQSQQPSQRRIAWRPDSVEKKINHINLSNIGGDVERNKADQIFKGHQQHGPEYI